MNLSATVAMQASCRGLGDLFAQRIDGKHVSPAFSFQIEIIMKPQVIVPPSYCLILKYVI